jgi:surface carbohydrate biosynthesis protein (TIGR04326 family)
LNSGTRTLTLWDLEGVPKNKRKFIVFWNGRSVYNTNQVSILEYVEKNSEFYRQKFLSWVHEYGHSLIGKESVIEHFFLEKGKSFWWMTSLGQKTNIYQRSSINYVIKYFALIDIIDSRNCDEIHFYSSNYHLLCALRSLAELKGIKLVVRKPRKLRLNILSSKCFFIFTAIIFWLWKCRVPLSNLITSNKNVIQRLKNYKGDFCFFDMFTYLDKNSANQGVFDSRYWTKITSILDEFNYKSLWGHNFYRSKDFSNLNEAKSCSTNLNKKSPNDFHVIVDSVYNFRTHLRVLILYFKVLNKTIKFKRKLVSDRTEFSWIHLLSDEIFESLLGKSAMKSLFYSSLYDSFLSIIPKQNCAFYIQENQPWEFALISAWRKYGHGKIIGIPHTAVRFWDLRYFYDSREQSGELDLAVPMPDMIGVNGPVPKFELLRGFYSQLKLIDLEALRYLYLSNLKRKNRYDAQVTTVLICGDFLLSTTEKIISMLTDAVFLISKPVKVIFKPHPSSRKLPNFSADLDVEINFDYLPTLLERSDYVITSCISTSAVDAFFSNTNFSQILLDDEFNLSPLAMIPGTIFLTSSFDLSKFLTSSIVDSSCKKDYFHLDNALPKWLALFRQLKVD